MLVQMDLVHLDSDRLPDRIAKLIVDVASSLKTYKHDVTISNIITRNDCFMAKATLNFVLKENFY